MAAGGVSAIAAPITRLMRAAAMWHRVYNPCVSLVAALNQTQAGTASHVLLWLYRTSMMAAA